MKHTLLCGLSFVSVWSMGVNFALNGGWIEYLCLLAIWIYADRRATEIYRMKVELETISKIPHERVKAYRQNSLIIDI